MRHVILLAALGTCAGCEAVHEVDNPRQFYIVAQYDGPEGSWLHEDYGAQLTCLEFACDEANDARREQDCLCKGRYLLRGADGLEIVLDGVEAAHRVRRFRDTEASGTVHLTDSGRLTVDGGRAFAMDFSGAFSLEAGPHRLTRGIFYSRDAEVR